MHGSRRLTGFAVVLALSWLGLASAWASSDAFARALAKGESLLEAGDYAAAVRALQKADRLADEPSADVLVALSRASAGARDYASAARYARKAMAAASTPVERARAQNLLGLALLHDPSADFELLTAAEAAFRGALDLTQGQAQEVRYNLAEVVERQGRHGEAHALLAEYLERIPDSERAVLGPQVRQRMACLERFDPSATPMRVGGGVTRPEKVSGEMPRLTDTALRRRLYGVVILEVIIDRQGEVTSVELLKPLGNELDRAAIDAISTWRFTPATYQGCPVPVVYNLTATFHPR